MSEKKRHPYTKVSKYIGAFTRKGIELPKYISSEEIKSIIKRGSKSTNNIKRFRKLDSFTPSPSHDHSAATEKSPEPILKQEESYLRNIKTRESELVTQKVLHLKLKNQELKNSIKDMQNKHQSQLITHRRENEKLLQNIKTLKKEQFEERVKVEDFVAEIKKNAKGIREKFEKFVEMVAKMVDNKNFCLDRARMEFNRILEPFLKDLSGNTKSFLFVEPVEFVTTGGFGASAGFMETIQSVKGVKEAEAIVLKGYKAQAHGELDLKLGDRVVIVKPYDSPMWLGKVNEKMGLFPSSHVMLD